MPKKKQQLQQSVKVIAGQWRSRKINFPEINGLRPTSARIRETLFNWLNPYIEQSHCLDLFAGSGALGIEALSRGAKEAYFVEPSSVASNEIANTLQSFQAQNYQIKKMTAENFLKEWSQKEEKTDFKIIFLDPPYQLFQVRNLFELVNPIVNASCLIYFEHDKALKESDLPKGWEISKNKKAGQVHYYLLRTNPA